MKATFYRIKMWFFQLFTKIKDLDYRHYIASVLLILLLGLIAIIRPEIYVRLWTSITTLIKTIGNIFVPIENAEPIALPKLEDYKGIIAQDFNQLIYDFKIVSLALFNRDNAAFYGIDLLNILNKILRVIIWIPLIFVLIMVINSFVLKEKPADEDKESQALVKFKKIENKLLPIRDWFKEFQLFLADTPFYTVAFLLIIAMTYRVLPLLIDFISVYFNLVKFFNISVLFNFITLVVYDVFIITAYYNKFFLAILIIVIILLLRAHFGRKQLERMQAANEEVAESLAVATLITGPPGSGKTFMATSLTLDVEMQFRNDAFAILQKYYQMFPNFNFASFEAWIIKAIEDRTVVNRSQIKLAIEGIWEKFLLKHDKTILFNYDFKKYSLLFFDGVKYISLKEALIQYGQSYFIYFTDKALCFSNLAVKHKYDRGGYFPLYDYDYINKNKRGWATNAKYSSIINFDSRRILNHVDPYDSKKWYIMDGQVELITELDKERGNQMDHVGLDKRSTTANQKNDGYNRSLKLTRHEFTIDNKPFTKIIFDTQREQSVNADLRETCEDRITIQTSKKDVEISLPFAWLDYLIFNPLVNKFIKYHYEFRSKRKDETLYNYLISKLINPLYKHLTKLSNVYGYKAVDYIRESGVTAEHRGESKNMIYYFINQKMLADRYATDAYSAFFDNERAAAKEGFIDAETYSSSRATVEELKSQNSYMIDEIEEATTANAEMAKSDENKL